MLLSSEIHFILHPLQRLGAGTSHWYSTHACAKTGAPQNTRFPLKKAIIKSMKWVSVAWVHVAISGKSSDLCTQGISEARAPVFEPQCNVSTQTQCLTPSTSMN